MRATWEEAGPLGINFAPDLSVLATSPATQRSHPHVVPGLSLLRVQGTPVAGLDYAASIGLVKGANRHEHSATRGKAVTEEEMLRDSAARLRLNDDADEGTASAMFHRCREAGINVFDCADVYERGR